MQYQVTWRFIGKTQSCLPKNNNKVKWMQQGQFFQTSSFVSNECIDRIWKQWRIKLKSSYWRSMNRIYTVLYFSKAIFFLLKCSINVVNIGTKWVKPLLKRLLNYDPSTFSANGRILTDTHIIIIHMMNANNHTAKATINSVKSTHTSHFLANIERNFINEFPLHIPVKQDNILNTRAWHNNLTSSPFQIEYRSFHVHPGLYIYMYWSDTGWSVSGDSKHWATCSARNNIPC